MAYNSLTGLQTDIHPDWLLQVHVLILPFNSRPVEPLPPHIATLTNLDSFKQAVSQVCHSKP